MAFGPFPLTETFFTTPEQKFRDLNNLSQWMAERKDQKRKMKSKKSWQSSQTISKASLDKIRSDQNRSLAFSPEQLETGGRNPLQGRSVFLWTKHSSSCRLSSGCDLRPPSLAMGFTASQTSSEIVCGDFKEGL